MKARKQNSTTYPILFLMVDSADHVTGKTGLSPTVTISKNGGSFVAKSGAVTEVGNGWYALAGHATDRNTLGELIIHAEAPGADPVDERYEIVAYDPFLRVNANTEQWGGSTLPAVSTLTAQQVWQYATRTLTAFSFQVTVGVNNDKTGYALTSAYDAAKTASQAGDQMALTASALSSVRSGLSTFNPSTDKVYLGNGAHGGAAASLTLSDYSAFKATGFSTLTTADIDARLAAWGKTGFSLSATTGWGGTALPTSFAANNLPSKYPATLAATDVSGELPANVVQWNSGALPGIGTSTLTAEQVWEYANRTLTSMGFPVNLTPETRAALVAAIEVELANDETGEALMQAIADKLAAEFNLDELTVIAIRDAILNRVLAGNHDIPGSVGSQLQYLNAPIDSRAPASTALSNVTWTDNRAALLDKLGVPGVLAHTGNADLFKATGFATPADLSGLATASQLSTLQSHGDSNWTTATGFATSAALAAVGDKVEAILEDTSITGVVMAGYTAPDNEGIAAIKSQTDKLAFVGGDVKATLDGEKVAATLAAGDVTGNLPATVNAYAPSLEPVAIDTAAIAEAVDQQLTTAHGSGSWVAPEIELSGVATSEQLQALQSHGDSAWATAVGFASPSDIQSLQSHGDAVWKTATGFVTTADLQSLAKEATLDEIKGLGWTDETLTAIMRVLETLDLQTTQLIVSPVAVTVSAGQVAGGSITQYQHAVFGPHQLSIVDSSGSPVNLSDVDLAFLVYEQDDPTTVLWSLSSGNGITVLGDDGNQVHLRADETHTGTAGIYRYVLWDMTNRQVRARGTLTIEAEAYEAL